MKRQRKPIRATVWSEEELLEGERVRSLVIILRTTGCSWWHETGGCIMCGYNAAASEHTIGEAEIKEQFERAWNSFDGHSIVKIYTSGSFLDEREVPGSLRNLILTRANDFDVKLLVESRPEFVTPEVMQQSIELCHNMEVAIGLESANSEILTKSIGKGITFNDYQIAAKTAIDAGASIRTYLLLKPPYLTEKEAISDVLSSIGKISQYSRAISINPVNVQRQTPLEKLWNSWAYRPPWLWSVAEIIKRSDAGKSLLMASLVGAGSARGAHNCGSCDSEVIASIDGFNLSQDKNKLDQCSCECIDRWELMVDIDAFALAAGDHERFFTRDL